MLFQHMLWGQVESLRKSQDTWPYSLAAHSRALQASSTARLYASKPAAAALHFDNNIAVIAVEKALAIQS